MQIFFQVLSQNEIDSLLGVGASGELVSGTRDLKDIFSGSKIYYERLPMLEIVFDRLARLMTTSLRGLMLDNVEVTLDGITTLRFGDYMDTIPLPAMLGVFIAEEWDNYGLLFADSALIYSVVDVLLGGRKGTAPMRIEGRPYTTIERNLVERMLKLILQDLGQAFEPVSAVNFQFERLESNPRFATIARPANAVVLVDLRIDMEERGGRLQFILPYATFEPIRDLLLQNFMGEKFGRDNIWEDHLSHQILSMDSKMQVVLDRVMVRLGDVMDWKVGSQITLNVTPESLVSVCIGRKHVASAFMGHRSGKVAIRFENVLENEEGALS